MLGSNDIRYASMACWGRCRAQQAEVQGSTPESVTDCSVGIAYSKIVLPSSDSKGEAKQRTYCPTTWTHCYQWTYAAQYADLLRQADASPLLCKECTLLARIQLSRKSPSHPECAFADCASTTMCGAMISLTPCIAPTVPRQCDLDASISFKDAADMIQQLNTVLSKAKDFPQILIADGDLSRAGLRVARIHV